MTYFNTTNAEGRELRDYKDKALAQQHRIMAFFEVAPEFLYTPSEICRLVFDNDVPLTSVRRAMTNLTNDGKLKKNDKKRIGPYGRPEHCWFKRTRGAIRHQSELFPAGDSAHV